MIDRLLEQSRAARRREWAHRRELAFAIAREERARRRLELADDAVRCRRALFAYSKRADWLVEAKASWRKRCGVVAALGAQLDAELRERKGRAS